jgi:DNA repair protein RecO (recombination protein O)
MGLRRSEAIVIGGHNLAEADRIIAFYTRDLGVVRAVAQGARRIRSRFGGSLEPFTHGHLVYFERPNRTLHSINEFGVLHAFPGLREDLERLAHAACVAELVATSSLEGDPNPDLFASLLAALGQLQAASRPGVVLHAFAIKVLKLQGYLPELSVCTVCRRPIGEGAGASLNAQRGGLICSGCSSDLPGVALLSAPAVAFLRGAARLDVATASSAQLPPGVSEELARALDRYLPHVLGRPLRSAAFLARI